MGEVENSQEQTTPSTNSLPESNFDKLQKNYPGHTDKIDFLNKPQFADIKETLAKTITSLAQEKIITPDEVFWNNIQKVTEAIFSDPLLDIDFGAKNKQAENIYIFRTKFKNLEKEYNKIKEESTVIQKESTVTQKESTAIVEKSSNIQKKESNKKIESKNTESRAGLDQKYSQINTKYKHQNDQELTSFKNQEKFASIINKIKENEPDTNKQEEKINNYFKHLFVVEKILDEAGPKQGEEKTKLSKDNYEFIQNFVTLNNNLGIQNTINLDDFTIDTKDTKTEENTKEGKNTLTYNENLGNDLVKNNKNIENFVIDTETNTLDSKTLEADQNTKNTIEENVNMWYKKEIQEGIQQLLQKNKLENYSENFDNGKLINTDKIPAKDKEKLEKIRTKVRDTYIAQAEEKILNDTNKVIKTKAVAALLQNIGQYFKVDNLAKDFTIDMKSGIEFDQKQLKLTGSLDGRDMTFYYDMNSGELFANDFIHHNTKDKTFYINRGNIDEKGREKLPLKMPTLKDTLDQSQSAYTKQIPGTLEETKDLANYEKNLNKNKFTLDRKSEVAEITIEHTMAKNIAIQETQEFLEDYITNKETYSKDKENQEYNLYNIIDTSFDRYTVDEIKTRRNTLTTFADKINPDNQKFKDGMLKNLFSDQNIEKDIDGNYDKTEGPSMYKFFDAITYDQAGSNKDYVINLSIFGQITNELTKQEGTTENIPGQSIKYKKLWNDFKKKEETTNLDQEMMNNPARNK